MPDISDMLLNGIQPMKVPTSRERYEEQQFYAGEQAKKAAAQKKAQDDQLAQKIISESGGDFRKAADQMYQNGLVEYGDKISAHAKNNVDMDQTGLENVTKKNQLYGQTAQWLYDNPTPQNAQKALFDLRKQGVIDDEEFQSQISQIPTDPEQIRQSAKQHITQALDVQKRFDLENKGPGEWNYGTRPDGTMYRSRGEEIQAGNPNTGQWENMGGMPQAQQQPMSQPTGSPQAWAEGIAPQVQTAESSNNLNAVSPAGAQGLMQLMPATAAKPGYGIQPVRDNSPAENQRVGKEYLAAMMKIFKDPTLALMAYNAGPGAVDAAMRKAGGDPIKAAQLLPQETQNYPGRVNGVTPQQSSFNPFAPKVEKPAAAPSGYRYTSDGSLSPIKGGPADPAMKAKDAAASKKTEDQGKAMGWLKSSTNAYNNILKTYQEDPESLVPGKAESYLPPILGDLMGNTGMAVSDEISRRSQSPARQKVAQAMATIRMDFLHAATGAGYTAQEGIDEYRKLAPQRGDKPEVVKQKLEQIVHQIEGLAERAGAKAPKLSPIIGSGKKVTAPSGAKYTIVED